MGVMGIGFHANLRPEYVPNPAIAAPTTVTPDAMLQEIGGYEYEAEMYSAYLRDILEARVPGE